MKESFEGTVHSIFERTFNIHSLHDGELYTVANHSVDNAPHTLVTDLERCSALGLVIGDRVYTKNQCLHVEHKLAVTLEQAETWHCELPAFPKDLARLESNLRAARAYIGEHGQAGGMKTTASGSSFEMETSRLLEERSTALCENLRKGNWEQAVSSGLQLIGLGPGLTPSGDDYLTGMLVAFQLPKSPLHPYRSFCEEVASASSALTNPISSATLRQAAKGGIRASITAWVYSMLRGTTQEMRLHLSAVLSIGSSSGTDIALGLIDGLALNLERSRR